MGSSEIAGANFFKRLYWHHQLRLRR